VPTMDGLPEYPTDRSRKLPNLQTFHTMTTLKAALPDPFYRDGFG
jgi:hypothetical protein